jgi:predicted glycoside hydrolase/deacetylase ChbG (UPF0249 family)
MNRRTIIVNADDFGQSHGINRGIIQAHERGIVTSTSMMVHGAAPREAAEYARLRPLLGVGLHLDLGECALRNGEWVHLYSVVDETDPSAVTGELSRQLSEFCDLVGRPPTHIDTHQHKHLHEPVRSIVISAADRFHIPVRGVSLPYCGRFYGQDENGLSHAEWIDVPALANILRCLNSEVTEIACHPAGEIDLETMYGTERLTELATLCDPRIRQTIKELGLKLASFADFYG